MRTLANAAEADFFHLRYREEEVLVSIQQFMEEPNHLKAHKYEKAFGT